MAGLPLFDQLLKYYPQASPDAVKKAIGGKVDADWITNTCTIRLSRAFNYAGVAVPRNFSGMKVISGADMKYYAYRVREMKQWLKFRFGKSDLDGAKPVDRKAFVDKKGVIAFDIHFTDATGHVDLWDGSTYTHEAVDPEDYFVLATNVVLWIAP